MLAALWAKASTRLAKVVTVVGIGEDGWDGLGAAARAALTQGPR